jgi:hypothetical protein
LESPYLLSSIIRCVSDFRTSDGGIVRCAKGGDEPGRVLRELLWDTRVGMEGICAAHHHIFVLMLVVLPMSFLQVHNSIAIQFGHFSEQYVN